MKATIKQFKFGIQKTECKKNCLQGIVILVDFNPDLKSLYSESTGIYTTKKI